MQPMPCIAPSKGPSSEEKNIMHTKITIFSGMKKLCIASRYSIFDIFSNAFRIIVN